MGPMYIEAFLKILIFEGQISFAQRKNSKHEIKIFVVKKTLQYSEHLTE